MNFSFLLEKFRLVENCPKNSYVGRDYYYFMIFTEDKYFSIIYCFVSSELSQYYYWSQSLNACCGHISNG